MGGLRIQGVRSWSIGKALRNFLCLGVGTHPMRGIRIQGGL